MKTFNVEQFEQATKLVMEVMQDPEAADEFEFLGTNLVFNQIIMSTMSGAISTGMGVTEMLMVMLHTGIKIGTEIAVLQAVDGTLAADSRSDKDDD